MRKGKQDKAKKNRSIRRGEIALYIQEYAATHGGNAPSIAEIARAFGLSKTTVYDHVIRLELEGRVVRRDGKLWLKD